MDGVVTGTAKKMGKDSKQKKDIENLVSKKYNDTIHIDKDMLIRTDSRPKEFDEYPLSGSSADWSKEVMKIVDGFK